MGTQRSQATRTGEPPTLFEAIAAIGYLAGMTVLAGFIIFGFPLLVLLWAQP